MLQELYDRCVATSTIRECKGQMQNPTFYTPNAIDEEQKRIINHLAEIDAEQRIQNSEIDTLKCGNFENIKVSNTLKVDKIESFSTGKVTFVEPVDISDLTVTNLHIECFCADDSEKFAGQDCDQWKEIINCSCVDDTNKFAGKNCTEWKDIITETYVHKAKDSDCFSGLTCTDWKNIIKTTCVDNAANSTKLDNKTYEEVCEDILSSIPPQPFSGEIDVYCGATCLCTINCDNPLVLSENAFNENAKIDTNTYPGACCTGTLVQSDIQDFITMAEVDACGYTTCTGTVVESDIADFITMNDVDQCGYTTCKGTVTSVKTCLNGTTSNAVTGNGTMSLDITPSLCFDSNSRKICNILGNKTSNEITLPTGINCTGTLVQSDIEDFITMGDVDACGYTTCKGTVTSVNNITPVNGNVTLTLPPDLSSDVTCLRNDVDAIEGKIPTQASTTNQLADKDFVNSSIETATATFVGTFDDVSCLPTTGVDNNDYAFVTTCDSTTGTVSYTRYKYSDYTHTWICEYTINTTGFTAEQLAALNSGITDALVAKITDVYNPTVCIYSNGTCCGSFTLNQSSNKCIGICNDKVSQTLLDTSANRPLLFASASITSGACCGVYYNTNITANSNTGVINASLNGLACRAKCNCVITTTCDSTYYPVFSPNNTSSYKYNYTNANLSYNPSTGTLTALCFNGTAKDSTCFAGCTYDSAKADIRSGLLSDISLNIYCNSNCLCTVNNGGNIVLGANAFNSTAFTTCVGTVTSVNVCLNGTNATAITTSGKMCLNLTPSLSYTANTRALTTTLGNKTSTAITLPEGINCTGTLVANDIADMATQTWVNNKNYCTHDCLVKLSLLCSNTDRRVLFSAQGDGCICPVYASNGVPFTYNACCGCLKIGDFTCACCHQLTLRPNSGLIHCGPKGTQNNLGVVYLEGNCLDNCSIGVGVGSGNINRGIFDYCKASETATSPTFRWLQYWNAEKEIHALPIWGELGANNKVVYSCTGTIPNNTRRYALICFDKTCCGNPSQISACFEIDIYTSKYNVWIDVANSVACMRTYWQTNGLDPNSTAYGSFCAALPDTTSNGNCFWITYSNYRAPVIKSARKISIICNTTTAPSGITFTAPTNRNSYTNVYCGATCVCTLQGPAELCLSANAFNANASISTTTYPGACCVGTVTSVNACLNGTSATAITSSGTLALDITPSLSLSSDNLTISLGDKTSSGIDLSDYVNDHKVTYTPHASSSKYPLIFSNATAPTSGSINNVGYSSGCVGYYQPNNGTLWVCNVCGNLCGFSQFVTKNAFSSTSLKWDLPIWTCNTTDTCLGYNSALQFCLDTSNCGHLLAYCFEGNANSALTVCRNAENNNVNRPLLLAGAYCSTTQGCTYVDSDNKIYYNTCTNLLTLDKAFVNCCVTLKNQFVQGVMFTKANNSGWPTFRVLADVTNWWDYYNTSSSVTGMELIGEIYVHRCGGYENCGIAIIDAHATYRRQCATPTATNDRNTLGLVYQNYLGSGQVIPMIVCDEANNKKCLAIRLTGSGKNYIFNGTCNNVTIGTEYCYTSSTALPTGWSIVTDGAALAASINISGSAGNSTCAVRPYVKALTSGDRNVLLTEGTAGATYCCSGISTCCSLKFSPATGVLTTNAFCGNLCGTASSAVNSTCFGGCTYSQACTNIRSGLVTTAALNSCGYTTCTGTLVPSDLNGYATETWVTNKGYTTCTGTISSISLNGNVFTVSNGAATLTGFKPATAVLADCSTTVKRNQASSGTCYLALLDGYSAVNNACIYVSSACKVTYEPDNGGLTARIFHAPFFDALKTDGASQSRNIMFTTCCTDANNTIYETNFWFCSDGTLKSPILCATSNVTTPIVNAAAASGANKVCNVIIRACCTNSSCALTCRNFTFCGRTGRMHGDICGNLYGNAYNSCLVCRYTINTGVQHVLLGANCTASANTCVRVSNGCPLTFDPETGTLCTCTICGTVCGNIELAPEHLEYNNGFLDIYKVGPLVTIQGQNFLTCDFVNCLWKYINVQTLGLHYIGATGTIIYNAGGTWPTCLIDNLCFKQCNDICGIQLRKINNQISLNLCSNCNSYYESCLSLMIPIFS